MDDRNEGRKPSSTPPDSLLSPERLSGYRLRQGAAAMSVCLVAGLAAWFTWIGLRHSDERVYKLMAVMGCAFGAVLLFAAFVFTLGMIVHSVYCLFRYRFGLLVLVLAILELPLFALPYFFH